MGFLDQASDGVMSFLNEVWIWFNHLNQQEWIALLSVVAVLGFFFVKGSTGRCV